MLELHALILNAIHISTTMLSLQQWCMQNILRKANCFAEADLKTGSLFSRKIKTGPIEFFKVVGYLPNGTTCGI